MTHVYLAQQRGSEDAGSPLIVIGVFGTFEEARKAADTKDPSCSGRFYISVCEIGTIGLPRLLYIMEPVA